jgi:hypothetical protein
MQSGSQRRRTITRIPEHISAGDSRAVWQPENWHSTTSLALARVVPDWKLRLVFLISIARSAISKNYGKYIWCWHHNCNLQNDAHKRCGLKGKGSMLKVGFTERPAQES